ncbi:MAG: lysylphosphatidylglycerol synthase transmembrane domain-containing protein [Pseudomonadota bacterium]
MPLNQKLKFVLKTTIGIALVGWVLKSKMVDFNLLKNLILNPLNLFTAFFFLTASALLCTARWLILVRGQGLKFSFQDLFSLFMIGNFFNTFMPGSVGGDLIKAWYMARNQPTKKTEAVFTVLLDRVLGLSVIIFYSAFTLFVFSKWLDGHAELKAIAFGVWGFSLVSFIAGIIFFCSSFLKTHTSNKILSFLKRFGTASKVLDATFLYREQPKQILIALFLSALSIFAAIYFHSLQGQLIGASLSLVQYFAIVPLAMIASAVPLLPGGIGTGQVAFFTLFKWAGIKNPEMGGTLCTLVQIYTILFNCLGYFFYLRFKRLPKASSPSLYCQ